MTQQSHGQQKIVSPKVLCILYNIQPYAWCFYNEWVKLFFVPVHTWYPKPIRWSCSPCFVEYNLHSLFIMTYFAAWCDSLSSCGFITIYTISSVLHPSSKRFCLLGSNWDNNGDHITPYLNYSNRLMNCGDQYSVVIGWWKWILWRFQSAFNMTSKYGVYPKYKLISLNKYWGNWPVYGSFQY